MVEMKKIKILKQTMAAKKNVRPGDILEVPDHEARYLCAIKKAEFVDEISLPVGRGKGKVKNGE